MRLVSRVRLLSVLSVRASMPARRRSLPAAALLALLLAGVPAAPAGAQVPNSEAVWSALSEPTPGQSRAIGSYTNGCLVGARPIPLSGPGHVVIRSQRNRFWGHPDLVAFVEWLSAEAAAHQLGTLMIGDLSQPRGGPVTGHASHEIGLDVDIWLRLRPGQDRLSAAELAAPQEISHVAAHGEDVDPAAWTPRHLALYRLVASHPQVERIFAHPAIKRALCREATGDRSWLARVRPWYGHDGHMHVRLACPADSPACVPQAPVPSGDGCGGELAWWFTDEPYSGGGGGGGAPPPLPAACGVALAER